MQVHPGGHAHEGVVDREGVPSSASVRPPQSVQSREVRRPASSARPEGAVHMPVTRGVCFVCGVHD